MAKKKEKKIYSYECTITGEFFTTTREALNPQDLISVDAYYELNPDKDDRPQYVVKKKELERAARESLRAAAASLGAGGAEGGGAVIIPNTSGVTLSGSGKDAKGK
ncbi:MAG: hypothetical protein HQK53_00100 [Oligoflexia bacterium]|nr:hypothetical protein [Oligoflexia bacterium]